MADDLEELRVRVAAARDRLTSDVAFVQKVELRLNDLARIVEGSLARQSAELDAAQATIAALDADLARAIARAEQAAGDAARADRLAKENGELRSMVMTLLDVIEGRQKSSLAAVMQKLEENVTALVVPEAPLVTIPDPFPEAETGPEPMPEIYAGKDDLGPEPTIEVELEADPEADWQDVALPDEESADPEAAKKPAPMEDLSEIALYDASEEVVEPGKS